MWEEIDETINYLCRTIKKQGEYIKGKETEISCMTLALARLIEARAKISIAETTQKSVNYIPQSLGKE